METAIEKVVDLVCEYTVEPIVRQCKYACCYKTLISDMKKAGHDLEKDKKIIEQSVDEASNNLQVITDKTKEWLQVVDEAHKEVTTLSNTYEEDQAMKCSCFGQILNPIARHQHGRKATKKKLAIEELRQKKPTREEICYAPPPSGIVTAETAAAAAARRTENGIYESSCWNEAFNKIMEALKDDTTNIVGLHGIDEDDKNDDAVKLLKLKRLKLNQLPKFQAFCVPEGLQPPMNALFSGRKQWMHDKALRGADRCNRSKALELKLLLSYGEGDYVQVPASFFQDMKDLRVMEFTNLRGALSMPSSTQLCLENLETLCLHNCSLDDISMIGELKLGLQILSFRGSDVRKLPKQLGELTALKMLDLSDCKELTTIEPGVLGSLTNLEELNMENSFKDWEIDQGYDARQPSNARLIELRNMSRLSNVKIHIPSTSMLPKDGQLFLNKLTFYKIMLGDVWDWDNDDKRPYRNGSKVLMLQFDDSPNVLQLDWVQATLQRTEVLSLRGSLDGKCESIDELCVKGFECLKHLDLKACLPIRYIDSSNSGSNIFSDLESLFLEDLRNLEKVCNRETFSSKLKVIKVKYCNKLTHLFNFSVLKCNSELEEIIIEYCKEIHCIVIDEDDKNDDAVKLLKLKRLKLNQLPKFQAFCVPEGLQPPMNALFSGRKVAFPCLESLVISELDDQVEDLWHPTYPPTELGKLRMLDVRRCKKLIRVINSNVLMKLLQHLESLTIRDCASIEHVFDVETHDDAISYSSLKELSIWNCHQLRTFGHYLPSEQDSVADNLSFFSQKEIFPCLEFLDFFKLSKVGEIWPDEVPPQTSFNMLKQVSIRTCSALSVLFPSALIPRLENLTDISVRECGEMRQIIKIEEKKSMHVGGGSNSESEKRDKESTNKEMTFTFFPCLTRLVLGDLPKLVTVYSLVQTHYDAVSFSSLKELGIYHCPQLRKFGQRLSSGQDYVTDDLSFFSQKVAFPRLESLHIIGLDELEDIWHPTDPLTELGKLRSLEVRRCKKLVRVINSNVLMKLLQHLESLTIKHCASLEHVFDVKEIVPCLETDHLHHLKENGGEGRSGDIHREMLTFYHLKKLKLCDLWNLESFSSSFSVDLNFPSLEKLTIDGCPKMRIFSNGGILTTPKLHKISWSTWNARDRNQLMTEDLNTTIQKKYAPVAEQMSNDESDSE